MAASFVVIITAAAARIHGVVEREGQGVRIIVILYSISRCTVPPLPALILLEFIVFVRFDQ